MTDGITITRTFAATPERVYDAWTQPEEFAAWFGTDAVPVDGVNLDVRVGGAWAAVMHIPDGPTINWAGEYTEVDAPSRLALTMTDDPANPSREPITVDIRAVDENTQMTMTQSGGNLTREQYEQTRVGWNGFFDVMEKIVTG